MREKICIMTATRAEYGLLKRLIGKLIEKEYDVRIAVTGMHLSSSFGYTLKEIEEDGYRVDTKIPILSKEDTAGGISKAMAEAIIKFADYFAASNPKMLVVLGDRYETLAVCIAAMNERIPIIHIHGGETTEGAIDECIRHAVSKMSYLHFTSCEEYRRRVIQLGEDPKRVFNVGGLGVENIVHLKKMSKDELFGKLNLSWNRETPYGVVTFHPVTLEEGTGERQMEELLLALQEFPQMNFIITKSNADEGGRKMNQLLERYVKNNPHTALFDSLGMTKYLNAVRDAEMVVGNSSSGILEVPSFQIPTVNIGDRQKGRIQASSVINCKADRQDIVKAMKKALSKEFKEIAATAVNPYGEGQATDKISEKIDKFMSEGSIYLKKTFYDIGGK